MTQAAPTLTEKPLVRAAAAPATSRFIRIHRNCLVARHELVELRRGTGGQVQAVLRHGKQPLEVSRRCVATLKQELRHL